MIKQMNTKHWVIQAIRTNRKKRIHQRLIYNTR